MSAKLALPLSFLGSAALALAVLALVVARDDPPTVTYLVYTAEERPLPRASVVEVAHRELIHLQFEAIENDLGAAVAERAPAGVVLDAGSYAELPREQLRGWRFGGLVLVVHNVDAAQVAVELEIERPTAPTSGSVNSFVLLGGTDNVIGDPANLERGRPFVGVTYRPAQLDSGAELGRIGWFQDDEAGLRLWLAQWALDAAEEYGRSLD